MRPAAGQTRSVRATRALVLTVADDSALGSKLQDELAVTLHAGGLVLVTQADVEVARSDGGRRRKHRRGNRDAAEARRARTCPSCEAQVTVGGALLLEDFTVLAISDLLSDGDCAEIPGLRVAAQGRGDGVYVGPVETAKQDCANPSQFDEQSAILTGSSLELNPSWVSAYVGSPALASSRNSISDVQWDLMLEASNDPPELEPTTHIGYALGHVRVATDEGGDWPLSGWTISESPKVGDDPPSCLDGSCSDNRSVREPHLLAELNDDGELRDLVLVVCARAGERPERARRVWDSTRAAGRQPRDFARASRHPDPFAGADSRLRESSGSRVNSSGSGGAGGVLAAVHLRRRGGRSHGDSRGSDFARARSGARRRRADAARRAGGKRARAVCGGRDSLARAGDFVFERRAASADLVPGAERAGRVGGGPGRSADTRHVGARPSSFPSRCPSW